MSNLNRHPVRRTAAGVLASTLAFSGAFAAGTPAFAATGFNLERIQGQTRYETSANIAAQFGTADGAILASGEAGHLVDALSASFLAGVREDPVLLTSRGMVSAEVLAQLNTLTNKRVTIVGGEMAVSEAVATQLRNAGFTVTRIEGDDRYETSEAIIRAGVAEGDESRVGILVSGQSPVDALAVGPLAYKGEHPVFLTAGGTIPQDSLDAMQAAGTTSVIIVGGTTVVPESVRAQLTAAGISVVTRLGGANRSETSRLVADYLIQNHGFRATTFNVASGANNAVDALSGAALSGKTNTVLLLTNTATDIGSVDDFAMERAATLTMTGRIFGGTAVVPETVETAIETAGVGTTQSATIRPELRSAVIVGTVTTAQEVLPTNPAGTTVRYTFDENVLETGAPPTQENFKLFNADGSEADSAATIVDVDGASVVVRFNDINTTAAAGTLTVATVTFGAVRDVDGNTNPEGDAAIGTTTEGGGATTLPAGMTDGPDLVSVGNFRQARLAGTTAIDFVFDEAAFVNNREGFALVTSGEGDNVVRGAGPVEGSEPVSTTGTPSGGTVAGGNGTTTLTVIFPGTIAAAGVSRATVDQDTVSDVQQNADVNDVSGNSNPLQAVDVSNGGNTAEPDLVSATLRPSVDGSNGGMNAVLFTFDQPVTAANAANFSVYTDEGTVRPGTGTAVINTAGDARQVLVNVENISRVVGASVEDAAVTAGASNTNVTPDDNEQDEVGVEGTTVGGTAGRTAGRTAAPDLTAVSIARGPSTTDPFGNVTVGAYRATYTFDEDVDLAAVTDFRLYLADGTMLSSTTCAVGTAPAGGNNDDFDNTVVCTVFGGGTGTAAEQNAQLGSATLGTVLEDAVNGEGEGETVGNPDGAEFTSGGTGTPVA